MFITPALQVAFNPPTYVLAVKFDLSPNVSIFLWAGMKTTDDFVDLMEQLMFGALLLVGDDLWEMTFGRCD